MKKALDVNWIAQELGAVENIRFLPGDGGIVLIKEDTGWLAQLEQPWMAGRAVGLIRAHSAEKTGYTLRQTPALESLGAMLDCSRNAVPRVESVKRLLRILSRMGYRALQLYMEDVFILEDYPYFGYGRQGYTDAELSALDDYAAALGIELVPAVQTLAHLKQTLKWDAMRDYVDVDDILLLDEEKTGRLIEAIFAKMRRCFRTEKINIGMDEAHMLGLGKYLQKHGFTDARSCSCDILSGYIVWRTGTASGRCCGAICSSGWPRAGNTTGRTAPSIRRWEKSCPGIRR